MNYQRDHIIGKQSIEISFDGLDDAFGVQDRIAELFYEKLQPRMNILFDEMFGKDHVVYIERLEVDCETIVANNWEEEWIDTTLRKLTDQLRQADRRSKSVNEISGEFHFYLEHGYLPWNSRVDSLVQFEDGLNMDPVFIRALLELVRKNPTVALRLVQNFSKAFVRKIIDIALNEKNLGQHLFEELTEELKIETKSHFIIAEAILVAIAISSGTDEELKMEVVRKINHSVKKDEAHQVKPLQKHPDQKEDEAIYISNAGLVIFHPFLPQLFEELGYWDKKNWKDEQCMQQAVITLQYLARGQDNIEEFELVLPKIMCGLPIEDIITENMVVNEYVSNACNELTTAVIGHWSVLKNTGIESFRNEFIQRNGKLSKVDHGWLVQVESKSVDVLLGSLPWSIGVVRLPWMKELLFTEWV